MSKIVIVYATTEGQTRKIANYVGDHLRRRRFNVDVVDAADQPGPDTLNGAAAVIVAASVHMHQHQTSVVRFVVENRARIEALPNAFVSVSLSAYGDDAEDDEDVRDYVEGFCKRTDWRPKRVHNAAGALKYLKYDFFKRWMMKRIAKDHDLPTATHDYEFTDWRALERFAEDVVRDLTPMG